jgi:hypothetical protein
MFGRFREPSTVSSLPILEFKGQRRWRRIFMPEGIPKARSTNIKF